MSPKRFLVGTKRRQKGVLPVERAALHLGQRELQLERELFSKLNLLLPSGELLVRVAEPRELLHERVYASLYAWWPHQAVLVVSCW